MATQFKEWHGQLIVYTPDGNERKVFCKRLISVTAPYADSYARMAALTYEEAKEVVEEPGTLSIWHGSPLQVEEIPGGRS